jgi:hypothetical protein
MTINTTQHGLKDWMTLHCFYTGLVQNSWCLLDKENCMTFVEMRTNEAQILLQSIRVGTIPLLLMKI